ncbi:hypothetical protein AVEN_250125-1 [Araneus ventricosus]|uniref:Uncharacterized protein n=1 Tax=Araneus ventricosus TaxID=182803 RepID=A0A4Y2UK90_ARAVE|nr:hypothetical protein AVEN_250125-1 [Araneus ventricosus]
MLTGSLSNCQLRHAKIVQIAKTVQAPIAFRYLLAGRVHSSVAMRKLYRHPLRFGICLPEECIRVLLCENCTGTHCVSVFACRKSAFACYCAKAVQAAVALSRSFTSIPKWNFLTREERSNRQGRKLKKFGRIDFD